MRTIDKIGLLSMIIAGALFLYDINKMNIEENEWRLNWKKLEIHGVINNIELHYKRGEK